MNFHEQISAWQADVAGVSRRGPGTAASGQTACEAARHREAMRLYEALALRFDREMREIAPKKPAASAPGALPC